MTSLIQWEVCVEKVTRPLDNLVTTDRVVSAGADGAVVLGNHIGAVKCIVQRAPTCVGRVERVAGVHHGNDKLRSCNLGNLGVYILGCDFERSRLRQQIANIFEHGFIGRTIIIRAWVGFMPGADLSLQLIAYGEEFAITRREGFDNIS